MPRNDNDTWSIAESVGVTAVMVAAARAHETAKPDGLINDPHAATLVRASGVPFFVRSLDGEVELGDDPLISAYVEALVSYQAARTTVFDRFFQEAAEAGVRQAVILASGLDSRAYRLPWPDGTTVYEIDQPQVLAFKAETLADVVPTARRVAVPVDLREDWPKSLAEAGLDPAEPVAWLAEGLLPYLPAEAERLLFERIDSLAAPGSRIAVENWPARAVTAERQQLQRRVFSTVAPDLDLDIEDLVFQGEDRLDVPGWLAEHGFAVQNTPSQEVLAALGRTPDPRVADARPQSYFVIANR
ncbi:class I SAM-dependent methyltransferase [Segniliparus rotundus]